MHELQEESIQFKLAEKEHKNNCNKMSIFIINFHLIILMDLCGLASKEYDIGILN